jgi:hypothetical protein
MDQGPSSMIDYNRDKEQHAVNLLLLVKYEKHGRFFIFFGKRDTVETDDILF